MNTYVNIQFYFLNFNGIEIVGGMALMHLRIAVVFVVVFVVVFAFVFVYVFV